MTNSTQKCLAHLFLCLFLENRPWLYIHWLKNYGILCRKGRDLAVIFYFRYFWVLKRIILWFQWIPNTLLWIKIKQDNYCMTIWVNRYGWFTIFWEFAIFEGGHFDICDFHNFPPRGFLRTFRMLWRTYSKCQNSRNSFCCNLFKVIS